MQVILLYRDTLACKHSQLSLEYPMMYVVVEYIHEDIIAAIPDTIREVIREDTV